jgi:hypothetical protein
MVSITTQHGSSPYTSTKYKIMSDLDCTCPSQQSINVGLAVRNVMINSGDPYLRIYSGLDIVPDV